MSFDAGPDSSADPIAFGQRLQILRTRRGVTREQLGGLMGRSASWVKGIETGRRGVPRLEVILRLAEVLRVQSLSDLTGNQTAPVALFTGPGHARLPAVRAAVDEFPISRPEAAAPAPKHLSARLARAWAARHTSPNHRDVIGALLPDLIRDAQAVVRQAETASNWRAAQATLAEVYALCQFFVSYQPDAALVWRVAERGMIAAQQSEDGHAIGVAAWLSAQAHRDRAHYDAAEHVVGEALRHLEPLLPDGTEPVRAIAGALRFEAGYTAARRGETGTAWRHWDEARQVADRLPETYFHPVTSFSRAIMGAHAVTVAVELHAGGESVRQAAASDAMAIPSRPRRARHRIEQARGYQLNGQPDVALATLAQAHEAAPETIRYNGYAKRIVLEETQAKSPNRRRRASALAVQLGLLAA
ncbi:helix-turn-helix transcriptional regulator [Streptomyces sp. NBC_00102]|uniref:helix-turn-helix domain-containing protein n=1 Tax=Streptomyces sp. NBC_00102 TaxID=2975652 RepID=UPI002255856B|nr:helix-turn-helix transcriptional regulator [Streptomyces sp. NBC_00102]MCX5398960.1 helix-turn-helix domain-containing protein [Streptomyces sp. NBC_00102]